MRALSSQQPRFLNNLCAFVWCLMSVCLSVCPRKSFKSVSKISIGFIGNFRHTFFRGPNEGPKNNSLNRIQAYFPGPPKNRFFWKSCAKKICLTITIFWRRRRHIEDFAEGEILLQSFPAWELRAHLPRGSSLVYREVSFSEMSKIWCFLMIMMKVQQNYNVILYTYWLHSANYRIS